MMSLQVQMQLRQKKERNRRKSLPKRSHCPKCHSTNLLSEGPDQLCCDCDWDTCEEYVEKGLMNNLEVAFKEHFLKPLYSAPQIQETKNQSDFGKSA